MREVIFDTETTGFGVEEHRVVEIGCVEVINRLPTGKTFHTYLNPDREIDFGATKVHGITNEKVKNCPRFGDIVADLMDFFDDSPLVAHNAEFDYGFINMELVKVGYPVLANEMVDTLVLARQKLPGQRHNLDALCRCFNIDLSARSYHGALLDAQLLAEVYVELTGGLQASFGLEATPTGGQEVAGEVLLEQFDGTTRVVMATPDELAAHRAFLDKNIKNSKWLSDFVEKV